jgi:hypothetical protein
MEVGITINEERMKSAAYLIGKGTVEFPEQHELDVGWDVESLFAPIAEEYAERMMKMLDEEGPFNISEPLVYGEDKPFSERMYTVDRDAYLRGTFIKQYHFMAALFEAYERERLHRILNSGDTERILFELGLSVDEEE